VSRCSTYCQPFGAKSAADVAADHAHLAFGQTEHRLRQHLTHAMRILDVGIERQSILRRVMNTQRSARLKILGVDARNHIATANDPRSLCKRRIRGGLVTPLNEIRDVVWTFVPHGWRAR
jgi:hypothetical protein